MRTRRARKNKTKGIIWIISTVVLLAVVVTALSVRAVIALPYMSIDLCNLAFVDFAGYNAEATAEVAMDEEAVDAFLSKVKSDYNSATFHNTSPTDDDYISFKNSLSFSLDKTENLANGNVITMTATYDEDLAKLLKIDVSEVSREITVGGLQNVTKLSVDDLFEDLDVSFEGVSPNLTVSMVNNSDNPFIKKMGFEIVDSKEYYSAGDTVKVKAKYAEALTDETGFAVDANADDCVMEFDVTSESEYITSAAELPESILEEAIEAGKGAFVDANEYGVRIFCEANLVPVYVNKKATFVYGTPVFVSAYFKTVFPEHAGKLTCDYNDLDIIYKVSLTQADGVSCTAFAAVRFENIIKHSDGTYEYDFSNPTILSESYFSSRVKANVTDAYVNTHEIEKVR